MSPPEATQPQTREWSNALGSGYVSGGWTTASCLGREGWRRALPLPWPPQGECGHKNVERPLSARPGGSLLCSQLQTDRLKPVCGLARTSEWGGGCSSFFPTPPETSLSHREGSVDKKERALRMEAASALLNTSP